MAYYAYLDENNVVTQVISGRSDYVEGIDWEKYYGAIKTSYTGEIRYNFAGVGYTYDSIDDAFIPPVPCDHPELTLNELKQWECLNEAHTL